MPLPWTEVNERDSLTVARSIELPRRDRAETRKFGCPFCGSSDALHAYPGVRGGFGCWAACGADRPKGCRGYSNIDVASQHWGVSPVDAVKRLASLLSIPYADLGPFRPLPRVPRPPRRRAPPPTQQQINLDLLRSTPGARPPPVLYADLLAKLALTDRGAVYLRRRCLDPEEGREYGFRSLDGPREWASLAHYLAGTYTPVELAAGGFPVNPDPGPLPVFLPWAGRLPALLIPFRRTGQVVGVRFRNVLPENPAFKSSRYRTLKNARPPWPYHADALRARVVHIAEGELNVETLRQLGAAAVGPPGAGAWDHAWSAELEGADCLPVWYDSTDRLGAGDRGAHALRQGLVTRFGEVWVKRRWRRILVGADPNALHVRGRLRPILEAQAWLREHSPEIRVA